MLFGYFGNYLNNVYYIWILIIGDFNVMVVLNIIDFDVVQYCYILKCEDYLQVGILY